jgi:DNA gyrase subunit A
MKEVRVMGRATQGVRIVNLKDNDKVVDVIKVPVAEGVPSEKFEAQAELD